MNDNWRPEVKEAFEYLINGGLGEVIGLTDYAIEMKSEKVVCETFTAMALCLLAAEAIETRKAKPAEGGETI